MLSKSFQPKRVFKEKIVQLYIGIINGDESIQLNDNFWDEFFLLKANGNALEQELGKIDNSNHSKLIINKLFLKCVDAIRDLNQLRNVNGLITLCSLTHYVFHTINSQLSNNDDLIDMLIGKSNFNESFDEFIASLCDLLFADIHSGIKSIVLKLLLMFCTAFNDVNSNIFLDRLMSDQIFDALIDLLNCHLNDFDNILLLLVIFLNYHKHDINNPYVMKLSIVDNEVILSGYSQVISNQLIDFNKKFDRLCAESKSGLFSTLSSMVGTIFSSEESNVDITGVLGKNSSFKTINTVLLAFFEAVLLNRNFISLLTTSPSETFLSKKEEFTGGDIYTATDSLPPNLLVAFLEFSSIVMLSMKDEVTLQTTRLCFIIMTCITEDSCANSIIHDNNMAFVVNLQRMPMRHRKISNLKAKGVRPISHALLDLMIEFILTHLNRNMQYDLFLFSLGIIQRLLCFQKRCRVRIDYCWKELWSALILLIKFLLNNESYLLKHQFNLFLLCHQIMNLFNLFIMCGDNFLSSATYYDELYYELIRMHSIFDNLNSLTLRHMTKESGDFKESAGKLTNSLINVKAIIAHFNAKIESYSTQNQIVTLSEEQVLEVVRNNYDSLTLKLQDNLDQFEPYNPVKQSEFDFFSKMLSSIIEDYVSNKPLIISLDEQHILVQQIQTSSTMNTSVVMVDVADPVLPVGLSTATAITEPDID